jgi:hypothetical protein
MGPEALTRADLALRTESIGFELSTLGETPRLGLAVVGKLAHTAGFEVSLQHSAEGGIRASIRVPELLLRGTERAEAEAPRTEQPRRRPAPRGPQVAEPFGLTGQGLPKRRRFDPAGEVVEP